VEAERPESATICVVTSALTGLVEASYAVVVPYCTCESEAVWVVQLMDAADEVIEPAATAEITGATEALFTITVIVATPVFPPLFVATAVRVWDPLT
jgi:hypothetical protein